MAYGQTCLVGSRVLWGNMSYSKRHELRNVLHDDMCCEVSAKCNHTFFSSKCTLKCFGFSIGSGICV